ncbi:MAG TPA: alpha/beta hydrolase [Xanthobacteraceae bacterium]|jgi:pimeloyl-ACP methyl ester carboxylesterase
MNVTKHFVTVGNRRVHYLRAGRGPALAMLHASPCSAKVMRPLLPVFGERSTCLVFDTPGFGLSDKLPIAKPRVEDFADALAETLDALGVEQAAAYGRHTGASIAVEFAARHPQRCAMAYADGYAVFAKPYTDEQLEDYLEPILPAWDGAHLLRLWFRYRDQHVFWPWNVQTAETRSDADVPDLDFLHRGVVELLEAGDDYRIGYAAPFRHRALEILPDLKVPVCFGHREGDSLYASHKLYPKSAWIEILPRDPEAAALAERAILERHPACSSPPPAPACAALPGRTTINYVEIDGTQVLVRSAGELANTTPLFVLPHAPGSSLLYDALILDCAPAFAVDLPGHGESDPLPGNPQSVEVWTDIATKVLDKLNAGPVRLYGHNGGAAVAIELAYRLGHRVRGLVLDAPSFLGPEERKALASRYAPDVLPVWEGSHWLRAWHHLRDAELWWPWFERTYEAARRSTPRIAPDDLALRVRETMKQPASYAPAWRAALSYPGRERLSGLKIPVLEIAAEQDVFAHLSGGQKIRDDAHSRAQAIRKWIDRDQGSATNTGI